ncbi:MAG: sigma-70 family RNA polymerase sigma factor [Eubacterium sp.]|nr:sigma-70 family RNA polymerase sigma factor [Eubacterium sp.]
MSDYNTLTDNELLSEIRNGEQTAITALIERYKSVVEIIVAKYRDAPLEREDLVQEGMIGLLAAMNAYSSEKGAAFHTFASRCIDNSVKTALKKFSRMKDVPPSATVAYEEEALDSQLTLSAEDEFLAKESVSALTEILYEGLSRFENEVLRLFIVGHSYAEIADKLGKNPKAIDNAIQRIRKKLNGVAF